MKLTSKTIYMLGLALAATGVTACDDNHDMDWNESAPVPVNMVSCSVAEGAELPLAGNVVEIVYDNPISLNALDGVTINGVTISTKTDPETQLDSVRIDGENASALKVMLPALAAGKSYAFVVGDRFVAGRGTKTFAKGFTVNFTGKAAAPVQTSFEALTNPGATAQAKNVHNFLIENHGKKILSGAMANVNNNNDFAGWIKTKTGKDVAIMGYDFIHLPESGQNWIDYSDITPAETQWNANGLVSYMWHWRVPTDEKAYNDKDYNRYDSSIKAENGGSGTNFNIENALTDGTWENKFIIEDIDKVAGYLKLLQDKGIPVIWRPLHEAAGSYKYGAWFWWGAKGGEATKKLWILLYDRLVKHHGLNNLIWVWTAQYEEGYESQMTADYPGNEYVDIIGVDVYADNDGSQKGAYTALLALGGGKKLVTLSETGLIQNPDKCIADGADWSWFNLWYTYNQHIDGGDKDGFGNTAESLNAVFASPFVLNRDQMPSLK